MYVHICMHISIFVQVHIYVSIYGLKCKVQNEKGKKNFFFFFLNFNLITGIKGDEQYSHFFLKGTGHIYQKKGTFH